MLISEEQLDQYRISGEQVRAIRDGMAMNDVVGIVVAWDDTSVVLRRANRRVVKLSRDYLFELASIERSVPNVVT